MSYQAFNQDLCAFLDTAVTPFHAVKAMVAQLEAAGFQRLEEVADWKIVAGGRYYLTRNDSSLIAFVQGRERRPEQGVRMVGAHTDSPCLMLKPVPDLVREGYLQMGVQVYGGALLNPWFDRDLSLAGRVSFADKSGKLCSRLIDFRKPVGVIPSLAIHLDKNANAERSVNPQSDMPPILCRLQENEALDIQALLGEQLLQEHPDAEPASVLDFELSFYDTQRAAIVGLREEFIAAARLDNLLSCYAGLRALLQSDGRENALLVCNDHEEVGSQSASGAQGPFLKSCLERWAGSAETLATLAAHSLMVSADNAHGVHPNFLDKHDENHGPRLNAGPVIKVNASQRYATNSESSGLFRLLCKQADVPVQSFVVRSDMGCGSTIGPITSAVTGISTLDVGVPTFAMHSIRELAGAADPSYLTTALCRFFDFDGVLTAAR